MVKQKQYNKKNNSTKIFDYKETLGCFFLLLGLLAFVGSIVGYKYRYQIYNLIKNRTSFFQSAHSDRHTSIHDIRNRKILSNHIDKVFGIDISHYQSHIKWNDVKWIYEAYPIHFVIVRSTRGTDAIDLTYRENWDALHHSHFVRGAYHYYRPDEPSTLQAQNFINTVKLSPGDLPPIIDIENLPKHLSINDLKKGIRNWIDIVESHYGVKPIIYSGQHYFDSYLSPEFNDCVLWIANYNTWINDPQSHWSVWQFSEKGYVNGIKGHVDLNVFNGDLENLNQLRIQ